MQLILKFIKEVWTKDWFDPYSSFLRLKSFWIPFLIITITFIVLCWKTSIEKGLTLDFINWTVSSMYEWFKIPLWTLALLIPIIGIFNANHKSEQSKESLKLTGEQNRFSNYYKHLEEFEKFIKVEEPLLLRKFGYKILDSRELHRRLFPNCLSGNFQLDQRVANQLIEISKKILLDGSLFNNYDTYWIAAININNQIHVLLEAYEHAIAMNPDTPRNTCYNSGGAGGLTESAHVDDRVVYGTTPKELLLEILRLLGTFNKLLKFDSTLKSRDLDNFVNRLECLFIRNEIPDSAFKITRDMEGYAPILFDLNKNFDRNAKIYTEIRSYMIEGIYQ